MITYHFLLLLVILIISPGLTTAFYKYISSYAFLNVRNENTSSTGVDFCVNFQQWRDRELPQTADEKNYHQLVWWNQRQNTNICTESSLEFNENDLVPADYRTRFTELKECKFNQSAPVLNSTINRMKLHNIKNILFLIDKGKSNAYGLHNFLFSQFYNADINDSDKSISVFYVYADQFNHDILPLINNEKSSELHFYQPHSSWPIDPALFVLWLFAALSILIGSLWAAAESKIKLHERKPMTTTTEGIVSSRLALNIENGVGETQQRNSEQIISPSATSSSNEPKNSLKRTQSEEIARMNGCQHCTSVIFTLIFVVIVLMFAFFFRQFMVLIFSLLLLLLGPIAVHHCIYAFLQQILNGWELEIPSPLEYFNRQRENVQHGEILPDGTRSSNSTTNGCNDSPSNSLKHQEQQPEAGVFSNDESASTLPTSPLSATNNTSSFSKALAFLHHPIKIFSLIVFALALALCITWFIFRNHHNAFYLLDIINFMLCIYAIKASRIRSFRLLTFLLLAMFGYDLFMVFGTRLLTSDGCSVMMQVVTGVDCQQKKAAAAIHSGKTFQPIAPIDQYDIPEKISILFYLPMLADPMSRCFDIDVEREYRTVMLGLGDVIIPGYLIAFCFYVDVVKRSRFYAYGFISMLGYSFGMAATFAALMLMETGQPALLYLVPFTLGPIFIWALIFDGKLFLLKMWRGEL